MHETQDNPLAVTVADAARLLGLSCAAVRARIGAGDIRAVRLPAPGRSEPSPRGRVLVVAASLAEYAKRLGLTVAARPARQPSAASIRRERDACRLALYGRAKAVSKPVG